MVYERASWIAVSYDGGGEIDEMFSATYSQAGPN